MNVFEFIVAIAILAFGFLSLIAILRKSNNIKQLSMNINIRTGIRIKAFFYKEK